MSSPIEQGFPDAFADLLSRNTEAASPDLDAFHAAIDESDYSMADWVEALVGFDKWLTSQKTIERPFTIMIGYINCCIMGNATKVSLPSLKMIVVKSLREFGFDGVGEYQI